jgi:ribosomal protein S14
MRRVYQKDYNFRFNHNKKEILIKALKFLTLNTFLPTQLRLNTKESLDLISKHRTKIITICLSSCRTRSVYRTFRLSRIKFRELCLAGKLPGVRKQS